jgi:hypothetical protein
MAQAVTQTLALLSDAAPLKCRAEQAHAFAHAHQGAALRTAKAVAQLLQ